MYSRMNCLIENDYIKGTFPPKKKSPMYSRMNCLIENEYSREKTEKNGKKQLAYFITGVVYYFEPGVGVLYCGGVY